MAYAWKNQKTFKINSDKDEYSVDCQQQRTSYGFRHVATLNKNGQEISTGKCTYQNRTWERYEYQSVIYDAIANAHLPKDVEAELNEWTKEGKEPLKQEMSGLNAVAMMAKLGDVICDTQEDKNAWKKRMLNTVNGVDFPEDFDTLSEDEKQARLDGAVNSISD
jgi:hypothetical protein